MTPPHGERRAPLEHGPRRHVWPNWMRIGYRFLNTKRGEFIARVIIGVIVFGVVAGWIMFKVIQHIQTAKVEEIEEKVEQIERKTESIERKTEERSAPSLDR